MRSKILSYEDSIPPLFNWLRYIRHVVLAKDVTYPLLLNKVFKQIESHALEAIDIGANVGIFTRYLSRRFQTTHAIEPIPYLAMRLDRCFASGVKIYNNAIGESDGDIILRTPLDANGNRMDALSTVSSSNNFDLFGHSGEIETKVKIGKLSSIVKTERRVGFIKIDVEGFERAVLSGSIDFLAEHKPLIMMEIGKAHDANYLETLKLLKNLDYEGFSLSNSGLKRNVEQAIEMQPDVLSANNRDQWYGQWDFIFVHKNSVSAFEKYVTSGD
jgi:FkbM family methyltransferase